MSVESDFDKQKALLEQRITFYESTFREHKTKDQDQQEEMKKLKRDF